jgi:hypothetical protein
VSGAIRFFAVAKTFGRTPRPKQGAEIPYHRAASLLFDLRALADEGGTMPDFTRRLAMIRNRHAGEGRFLARLAGIE